MYQNQEPLSIKWNFYQENIHKTLETEALKGNNFADVTIVSEDLIDYKSHKFVLSACSPLMKEILMQNPHDHPLIYLDGVQGRELQYLLQFLYCGETKIPYNYNIENLFMVIEMFRLTGFDLPTRIT